MLKQISARRHYCSAKKQKGFTLTEVLLATAISMAIFMYAVKMQADFAKDLRAKIFANQMLSIKTIAIKYFKMNRLAIIDAMNTGANASTWCTYRDAGKKLCIVDVPKLVSNGVVPSSLKSTFPLNQRVLISYRLVNASTGMTEVLIFGGTNSGSVPLENDTASFAAQLLGEDGGIVPSANIGSCSTNQACGNFGAWNASLANFTSGGYNAVQGTLASYAVLL